MVRFGVPASTLALVLATVLAAIRRKLRDLGYPAGKHRLHIHNNPLPYNNINNTKANCNFFFYSFLLSFFEEYNEDSYALKLHNVFNTFQTRIYVYIIMTIGLTYICAFIYITSYIYKIFKIIRWRIYSSCNLFIFFFHVFVLFKYLSFIFRNNIIKKNQIKARFWIHSLALSHRALFDALILINKW